MIRFDTHSSKSSSADTADAAGLARHWAGLLRTYRRDGRPVSTAVNVALDHDHIVFRTYAQSGKFKRLRNNPRVAIQACDIRGRPTSTTVLYGVACPLEGAADLRASRLIDARHPFFQKLLVRLAHRIARYETVHFAVLPESDTTSA